MTDRKVVAIHQPNFFPWMGYFDKIIRADIFILLDNVQFPKTGGTWSNRVRIVVNGQAAWVTMPIVRAYHGVRKINEMKINNVTSWRANLLKTIQMNYARTPFFNTAFPLITELVDNATNSLADYNINIIKALADALHLDVHKFILGSNLNVDGDGTDLLIMLTKAVGGAGYLCGGGAGGYQVDENFAKAGIELIYQDFKHPVYSQINTKEFISGLSILDALMNCGFEGTQHLIKGYTH